MLLHKHSALRGSTVTARAPARQPACKPWLPRRSLHVMRFKEGEKLEEDRPIPDLSQPPEPAQAGESTVHHGHMDPIRRSRDALSKLLGRHSNHGDAGLPADSARSARSTTTPAFEAPLSVPVFSRRREVGARVRRLSMHLERATAAQLMCFGNLCQTAHGSLCCVRRCVLVLYSTVLCFGGSAHVHSVAAGTTCSAAANSAS